MKEKYLNGITVKSLIVLYLNGFINGLLIGIILKLTM